MLTPKHPCAGSAAGTAATGVVYGNIIDEAHDQLEETYAPGDKEDASDAHKDADDNNSVTSDASSHPEVVKSLIRTGTIGTAAAVAVAAAAAAASVTQRSAARDKAFFKMTLDLEIEEAGSPGSTKRKLFERDVINGKT
jgi:hypothetical protein